MKILIAHNSYQQPGGEDAAVDNEAKLLEAAGHKVEKFCVSNEGIESFTDKIRTVIGSLNSREVVSALRSRIRAVSPDIVHFHNTFPCLSPGAIEATLALGVPVVQTLHNFRLICADATFLRNGRICEHCLGRPRLPSVFHRCYRGSAIGSAVVGLVGRRFQKLHSRNATGYTLIALTAFAKQKLVADGYDPDRIVIKGNTIADPGMGPADRQARIVFAGRLSHEKGADLLLRIAPEVDAEFEIIGDGPERALMKGLAGRNVSLVGRLPHDEALRRIKRATAIAVPSRCHESFPVVVVEALATATPLLVTSLGSLPELVDHGKTGSVMDPNDFRAWIAATRAVVQDAGYARRLGNQARAAFEERHTAAENVRQLEHIYVNAISEFRPPAGVRLLSPSSGAIAGCSPPPPA